MPEIIDPGGEVDFVKVGYAVYESGACLVLPRHIDIGPGIDGDGWDPSWYSPAFRLAVDLIRHFVDEGDHGRVWQEWEDTFAAYVGDEIADQMTLVHLPNPVDPLVVAAEMRLTDSAVLTDAIRREIEESTVSLEYLSRQWIERAMVRIVRAYYLGREEGDDADR